MIRANRRAQRSAATSGAGQGLAATFGSLRVRNYRLFAFGQLFSNTGSWVQRVAQDWLVLTITGSATAVGITAALQSIPSLFFGLSAGLLADRYPRRRLLLYTQCGMASMAALLAVLTLTHTVQAWHIYLIAFGLGSFISFDQPARQSIVNELVGPDQLRNAISLNSAIYQLGALIGPAISGVLLTLAGPGYAFTINAVSYVGPFAALLLIDGTKLHIAAPIRRQPGQLRAGLRYVRQRPQLLWPTVIVGVFGAFPTNLPVTLAALAKRVFHSGAGGYSVLTCVVAVGSLVGALIIASVGRPGLRLIVGVGLMVATLCMAASLIDNQVGFLLILLPIGAASMILLAAANSLIQMTAEDGIRGRVVSVYFLVFMICSAAGAPLLGWVIQRFGAQAGMFLTGAAPALVIGAVGLRLALLGRGDVTSPGPATTARLITAVRRRDPVPAAVDGSPDEA